MPKFINHADDITTSKDCNIRIIPMPEAWGGPSLSTCSIDKDGEWVVPDDALCGCIASMTSMDLNAYWKAIEDQQKKNTMAGFREGVVCRQMVKSPTDRTRLFSDSHAKALETKNAKAVEFVFEEIRRHNGLMSESQEAALKNSVNHRTPDSSAPTPEI